LSVTQQADTSKPLLHLAVYMPADPIGYRRLRKDVMATIAQKICGLNMAKLNCFWSSAMDALWVGRISAHLTIFALAQPPEQGMGPGTIGVFLEPTTPMLQSTDRTAEGWLRTKKFTRALGAIKPSDLEEPGLLFKGHESPPTVLWAITTKPMAHGSRRRDMKVKDPTPIKLD
jgi:hypothetical protein